MGEIECDEATGMGIALEVTGREQAEAVAAGDEGGLKVRVVDFGADRDVEADGSQLLEQRGAEETAGWVQDPPVGVERLERGGMADGRVGGADDPHLVAGDRVCLKWARWSVAVRDGDDGCVELAVE